jgi:hypothetical protein
MLQYPVKVRPMPGMWIQSIPVTAIPWGGMNIGQRGALLSSIREPYFVPRQCALLCGPYRHICVCARSTVVFHGVYGPVSFVDDFVVLALMRLHFSPDFPRFVSF